MFKTSVAELTLQSISPYSQSRYHETPRLKGELDDAYNKRTWQNHCLVDENGFVCLPPDGLMMCLVSGARYSKKKIPGQGKATWTTKFQSGLMPQESMIPTNVKIDDVTYVDIFANSDGVRGSGKRVMRRYPMIDVWEAQATFIVMDEIITEEVFREIVDLSGMFIGLGRYRPEKGGLNGRFKIKKLVWQDNRKLEDLMPRQKPPLYSAKDLAA